jgi:ribosomal protein S11
LRCDRAWSFTAGNNDTFTGSANYVNTVYGTQANINVGDQVNGGAGKADKLVLTTNGTLSLATAANISGFEQLTLADGGNTITLNGAMENSSLATLTNGNYNTITGGNGYDTIVMAASNVVGGATVAQVANLTKVTGIEAFDATTPASITFAGAAVNNQVVTSTANNTAVNMADFAGNSVFLAGAGTKNVTGGATSTNDKVTLVSSQTGVVTIDKVETVVGYSGTGDAVQLTSGAVNVSEVSTITSALNAVDTVTFSGTTGQQYIYTANDAVGTASADTVTLNATSTIADGVKINTATKIVDNDAAVTINNFTVGTDKITLLNAATSGNATATFTSQSVSAATNLSISANVDLTFLNYDMGGTNGVLSGISSGTGLIANINNGSAGTITAAAAGATGFILAYDNGNGYLYQYNAGADTDVAGSEMVLVGILNNVAVGSLTNADFILG